MPVEDVFGIRAGDRRDRADRRGIVKVGDEVSSSVKTTRKVVVTGVEMFKLLDEGGPATTSAASCGHRARRDRAGPVLAKRPIKPHTKFTAQVYV
jgi:translation elongation factor EF-Tu-like GTPase